LDPAIPDLRTRLRACTGVLVDSNILLDIAYEDPAWSDWSRSALNECAEYSTLVINPIIYAEVSVGFTTIEALDASFPAFIYDRQPLPWRAAFLAGKCFIDYRRRGGQRTTTMPDFYIGAHAAIAQLALLTLDASRYRSYFPTVEILTP
jgi:predicted nucleic acid-binding protein